LVALRSTKSPSSASLEDAFGIDLIKRASLIFCQIFNVEAIVIRCGVDDVADRLPQLLEFSSTSRT
jgi:hypothetical protein